LLLKTSAQILLTEHFPYHARERRKRYSARLVWDSKTETGVIRRDAGPMNTSQPTEIELRALERVRRAGVRAPQSAILAWVRAVGAPLILSSSLREIRLVARAF